MAGEKFKPQFRRILYIHRLLKEDRYPNATTIARDWHIECSPRTIKRDIDYLRDELNAPIEYDPAKRGYFYDEQGYDLPTAIMITEGELFSLSIAQHILEQYRNTPVYPQLQSTFGKIERLLPSAISVQKDWVDTTFSFTSVPGVEIDEKVWKVLFDSLRTSTRVKIWYTTPGYDTSLERVLAPYHIFCNDALWYVIGHDSYSDDIRLFALHRIEKIGKSNNTFTVPDDFSYTEYIDAPLGMFIDKDADTVKLLFTKDAAPYIREREWHPEQELAEEDNGSVLLSFKTRQLTSVLHWALSWGGAVKVLEPERLITMMKKSLIEAMGRYQ
jgi:proteasome accessory factor B